MQCRMLSRVLVAAVDEQVLVNYSHICLFCFLAPNEFTRLAQVISNNIHKINQNGQYCMMYFNQAVSALCCLLCAVLFFKNMNFFQFTVYQSKLVESYLPCVLGTIASHHLVCQYYTHFILHFTIYKLTFVITCGTITLHMRLCVHIVRHQVKLRIPFLSSPMR